MESSHCGMSKRAGLVLKENNLISLQNNIDLNKFKR